MIIVQLRLTVALSVSALLVVYCHRRGAFCLRRVRELFRWWRVTVMRVVRAALSFEVALCPAPRALSRVSWLRASLGSLYDVLRRCGSAGGTRAHSRCESV